jgi:hypothetical protein
MDIHTWVAIPEAELAKKSFFYMDDVSLQVIEEPPLELSMPLDEYYVGESIPWTVKSTVPSSQIKIALLSGERLVAEETRQAASGLVRGNSATRGLQPGVYTLRATIATSPQPVQTTRQVIVALDPFGN